MLTFQNTIEYSYWDIGNFCNLSNFPEFFIKTICFCVLWNWRKLKSRKPLCISISNWKEYSISLELTFRIRRVIFLMWILVRKTRRSVPRDTAFVCFSHTPYLIRQIFRLETSHGLPDEIEISLTIKLAVYSCSYLDIRNQRFAYWFYCYRTWAYLVMNFITCYLRNISETILRYNTCGAKLQVLRSFEIILDGIL